MGRKSTKENKNIYQLARDELEMTRSTVEDKTNGLISASRLEKLENGLLQIQPSDVMTMAELYDKPELCNYYCTKECEIGKKFVPIVETIHDLPQITLEILASLNAIDKEKDNLIDISADGEISDNEKESFIKFYEHLKELSFAIEALKLWTEKNMNI